jgi:cell division protease FtsH
MSDELGPVTLAQRSDGFLGQPEGEPNAPNSWRPYSDETARLIDSEVRRVLEESYAGAMRLLRERRSELDALANALLEQETLDEQEILRVTGLRRERTPSAIPLPVRVAAFGKHV